MNYNKEEIIQQTQNWLEKIVVGLNFCPFAKREIIRNSIHYKVSNCQDLEQALLDFALEMKHLDEEETIETTLVIYPFSLEEFEDYLDFVDLCQGYLEEGGYEGIYQLATFHPNYCFADVEEDDVTNYTNRSPYPILHLLREQSLENALEHYEAPELIPETNIRVAREAGLEKLQQLMKSCFE